MTSYRFGASLASLLLVVAACSNEPADAPTPTAIPAIVDAPPYVCKFVPEHALRLISGSTQPLSEVSDGTSDDGDCDAHNNSSGLLDVAWSSVHGDWTDKDIDNLVSDRIETLTRHDGTAVPESLGKGMAAYIPGDEEPYQVVSKFTCGGKVRLLIMRFREFVSGRNSINDMIELMRIGQKRYAELYKCDLGK
ncbi:hypothetical protein AB0K60_01350 [Thermopolyspora sp. NPDC052614]|uniref:hypothetical protein n=1 Tax=Thermopolyspora sp. NPDC052614 TaxID=3155682 RepID=UPI00341EB431